MPSMNYATLTKPEPRIKGIVNTFKQSSGSKRVWMHQAKQDANSPKSRNSSVHFTKKWNENPCIWMEGGGPLTWLFYKGRPHWSPTLMYLKYTANPFWGWGGEALLVK